MALLNFPLNPIPGQTYVLGSITYQWNGSAWLKTNQGNINATTVSATNILINGAPVATTATVMAILLNNVLPGADISVASGADTITVGNTSTLQTVTGRGHTTTNIVHIANTSNAISLNSAALVIDGGASVGGDLWLGGTLFSGGVPVITTATLGLSLSAGSDILITNTGTGDVLVINDVSTLDTVLKRGNSTTSTVFFNNTTTSTSSSTGAVVVAGGLGVGGRISSESLRIADSIFDSTQISINTTDTVVVDSYSSLDFRSSKYLIQIDEGSGPTASFETIEILLLVDNVGTVYATEYAVLSTNGEMGEFAADVQGDNMVRLYFTPYQATNKVLKLLRTAMTV